MKKVILISIFILTVFASAAQRDTPTECAPAEGDPIRIGAVFPEGNLISRRADEPYQGAQAMLQAINACGGVNGSRVEWVYLPANDRDEANEAAQTLIGAENLPLIIGSGALAISETLVEIAEQKGVILWEVSEPLTGGSQWAFSPRPSNQQLGQSAAEFAQTRLQSELGLGTLRVALIHESRPRGQQVAAGILDALSEAPAMQVGYENDLFDTLTIAERIRDEDMNVVMLGAFDLDAARLWYAMQEEDANIDAWIHVGSSGFRRELCQRWGNNDGLISVSVTGIIQEDYHRGLDSALYRIFREQYIRTNSEEPTEEAMLSASGVYMLLRYVLPTVEGDFSPENIRDALLGLDIPAFSGWMGEGLSIDPETRLNRYPGVIIQQRQQGLFCSIWPDEIATCGVKVAPFPTWRQRAIMEENFTCSDPV